MVRRFVWDNLILIALSSATATALGGISVAVFGFEPVGMLGLVGASIIGACIIYSVSARSSERVVRGVIDQMESIIANDEQVNLVGSDRLLDIHDQISRMHARSREEIASRHVAVSRSEELLKVLSMLEGPVIVFDRMGAIRLTNAASDALFGCAKSPVGTGIIQMLDDCLLRDQILDGLSEGAVHGRIFDCEYDTRQDDEDSLRQFKASIVSLGDSEEGPFVLSLLDLTRENRVSRMKSDFVSKASHELRTPMASIRAYLEMLVDDEIIDEAERRKVLTSMLQDTDRLSALVDNMLNISRIEAGMVRPVLEKTDLGLVSERVLHRLGPAAAEKNISLSTSPSTVDLTVEADAAMLEQVVENLASNAIKYTPEGGRVDVGMRFEEERVWISVSDTGFGIPSADLDRIFERFYRVDKGRSRAMGGTGLGLAIVRHVVEAHGERVLVESEVGQGTTFSISLSSS